MWTQATVKSGIECLKVSCRHIHTHKHRLQGTFGAREKKDESKDATGNELVVALVTL